MSLSLLELAHLTGGEIRGDDTIILTGIAAPNKAIMGEMCFITDPKRIPELADSKASVAVLPEKLANHFKGTILLHENPYYVYAKASQFFSPYPNALRKIHPSAMIDSSATLGNNLSIAANVVIGAEVVIGDHCVIGANTVIDDHCQLGEHCILRSHVVLHTGTQMGMNGRIHSGAIIGDDGFGFAPHNKKWERIEQLGSVWMGDNVDIGTNTTIDRAALGVTHIGHGVKIDNQVQIGHGVHIGDNTVIAACTAIAGGTLLGEGCKIGGACGISGHITLANRVTVMGMTRVIRSLKTEGEVYMSGTGISKVSVWRRNAIRFSQLNDMSRTLKDLQKRLIQLVNDKDKD
ncbi:MAG: UDP-3-O-(3-hydroxymyristoyl)glucosamine N-acyltransferase [Thiotrichaceae bacterium]|nr:UDP-3-O-(3-hydroxymyristoyl)glucosamine N-acyltransferase [Thiotrichaceae bacterium]